jgi:prevent-host-death family protein
MLYIYFQEASAMKTYPLNEARAAFSKLVERALSGEPQRVTRYGKEAVVIVSEDAWRARSSGPPTLGALLAQHARAGLLRAPIGGRPWKDRRLGAEFE